MAEILWLTFGLILLNLTSAHANLHHRILALKEDNKIIVLSDAISVNSDLDIRTIFLEKCQMEGERELFDLANTSSIEESYVFIPSLCVWIETGYSETEVAVRFDKKFFDKLISQYKKVVVYHVHPGDHVDVGSYFPAYKDFIAMTLINADLIDQPEIVVKHRVVAKIAVMEFDFANKEFVKGRIGQYRKAGIGEAVAQNLSYDFMRRVYVEQYFNSVTSCSELTNNDSNMIDLCHPLVTDVFVIRIQSFQTFQSAFENYARIRP